MNYRDYEKILHAVLDDEIMTARSMRVLGGMSDSNSDFLVEYLTERRITGNSGRVPTPFKAAQMIDGGVHPTDHERILAISQIYNHWANDPDRRIGSAGEALTAIGEALGKPF